MRRHLADIPNLVAEAQHYLTPGSAPLDPTNQTKGKGSVYKIPIVAEIYDLLDLREKNREDVTDNRKYAGFARAEAEDFHINNGQRRLGVLPTLGLWVSLSWAELDDLGHQPRECCLPKQHTITGETNWLSDYAEQIIELHSDFPRDIEQLWTELRKACRIRREYVPTCPICATATTRWRVEAVYGDDGEPAWWRCTGCAKTWVRDAEVKRFALTQPKMTLGNIASWLGLPLRTLHNWRTQGRFTTDHRGLAEVEHVKRAAEAAGRIPA